MGRPPFSFNTTPAIWRKRMTRIRNACAALSAVVIPFCAEVAFASGDSGTSSMAEMSGWTTLAMLVGGLACMALVIWLIIKFMK